MATLSQLFGTGNLIPIEVFAVGGGGGGSYITPGGSPPGRGNGGGAGMVLYSNTYAIVGKPYTITIGAGGAGGPAPVSGAGGPGLPGSDTSFGGTAIAYGGSGADILFGNNNVPTTLNFGSVGGGTGPIAFDAQYTIPDPTSPPFSPISTPITSYKSTFLGNSLGFTATPTGFVARNGWVTRSTTGAGPYTSGGGGAGSPGEFTVPGTPSSGNAIAGRGGYGISGSVVGLTTTYGGGGGAGVSVVFTGPGTFALGQAGRDGGGGGGYNFPTPALANRGGGGGGGGYFQQFSPTPFIQVVAGGSGGSGFLFIRYPTAYSAATVVGNAPTTAQPGYNVYAWTSGPGSITFN